MFIKFWDGSSQASKTLHHLMWNDPQLKSKTPLKTDLMACIVSSKNW